ncbi:sodium/hydrogen exchanger 9B2 [Parasteatoda tepidariorum]|uniref:sodium/hydrogen exchanger 9B2 n=1 Tax=Parasteatoda tepidariorum TaxID=114398 RepID=UPI001C728B4A|nr:sodium/hydrogen exchanger 9B2 [Parasteatoda tepidariorum]
MPSTTTPLIKSFEQRSCNMSVDHAEPEEFSKRKNLQQALTTCPPVSPLSTAFALILSVLFIYGTLWGLMGDDALPGGPVFGLYILVIICYLGGQFMKLLRVPTLVGMMVFGFILRNVPHINVAKDIPEAWAGNIRNLALIFILLRAGLEVDSDILKNNKNTCFKVILIPFVCEVVVGSVAGHYLLEMPWIWSFLLGSMLSAVSPAVVLPVMLKMMKKGFGMANGIPTMVIAVAGIDDVLALTAFEILLGVTFATGTLAWTVAQGPVEIVVGISYGIIVGVIFWYVPNPEEKSKSTFRFMMLVFAAMCVFFGSQALGAGAAGALGCICLPFTAAIRWKKKDWDDEDNPVGDALSFVWRIIEPFLFGLIGSEIRIDYLQPETVGLGLGTMFVGLASRMIGSMFAAYSAGLTLKEQIFITFAGMPKATVQAAIGPVPLAMARKFQLGSEIEQYGIEILTVAVLAILITAPLGATAIAVLAPRLLEAPEPANKLDGKINIENKESTSITMYGSVHTANSSKEDGKVSTIFKETTQDARL